MIKVEFICDDCGKSETQELTGVFRSLPTTPPCWNRSAGVLRCPKCLKAKRAKKDRTHAGPFWVCSACFSPVTNSTKKNGSRHVRRFRNELKSPYAHIKEFDRWPGSRCKPPRDIFFYGPFKDRQVIDKIIFEVVQCHINKRESKGFSRRADWTEKQTAALRKDLHSLLLQKTNNSKTKEGC